MAPKRVTKPSSKSSLLPRGDRKTAKVGQRDETLLRLLCDDSTTGEVKELHFRNIPHKSINWSDASHIAKINNWRNQIYGRAGMKSKSVLLWVEDEELWFELYYQLSIAEACKRGILLPKVPAVLAAFNRTFLGHILRDGKGGETKPRKERSVNAFASKLNRMCAGLRARLNQCVFGKSGDVFVPSITLEMLDTYKCMKQEMVNKGITVELAYSDDLEEWLHFFRNLPTEHDAELAVYKYAEREAPREEIAAAALLDLYSRPIKAGDFGRSSGASAKSFFSSVFQTHDTARFIASELSSFTTTQDPASPESPYLPASQDSQIPSLPRLSFSSSQDAFDGPITPPRRLSYADIETESKIAQVGTPVLRNTVLHYDMDFEKMIVSPD